MTKLEILIVSIKQNITFQTKNKKGVIMSSDLIIVADLQHFKLFNVKKDPLKREAVELLNGSENLDVHQKISEKVSDRQGNFQSDYGSGTAGENHNIELEEERRRIKEIANQISQTLQKHTHESWCFAAPKAINNKIVELLDAKAKKSMRMNLQSNLANIPHSQLLEYFSK